MQIFHVLAAIIERLGSDVQPYTAGFLQLLPSVWQQAEGMPLVRLQVTMRPALLYTACMHPGSLITKCLHCRSTASSCNLADLASAAMHVA